MANPVGQPVAGGGWNRPGGDDLMAFPDFLPESPPAGVVQLPEDIVGQDDGWGGGAAGVAAQAAQAEGQDKEALLSLRGVIGGVLPAKEDPEIVALRALQG